MSTRKVSKQASELSTESSAPSAHDSTALAFRLPVADLKAAVAKLALVADRKSNLPIISSIVMRAERGDTAVTMTATDLTVSLRLKVPCTVVNVGVGIAINAKLLADTLGDFADGDISLYGLRHGGCQLECGATKIGLQGYSDRDAPKFPALTPEQTRTATTVGASDLREMLDGVRYAVCKDETRFHLNGVLIEATSARTRMVATDGHRLTMVERDACMNALDASTRLTKGAIIPSKACAVAVRLLAKAPTCELTVTDTHAWVCREGTEIVAKLIDAQFPPYEQVIPRAHVGHVIVDIARLTSALKRSKKICTSTRGATLALASGKLTVSADHPESGTVSHEIPVEHEGCAAWKVGINPAYLLETLDAFDVGDRVVISVNKELDPIVVRTVDDYAMLDIRSERAIAVVMPMRL